jgi:hypothetical protein
MPFGTERFIGLMGHTFARVGAVIKMKVEHYSSRSAARLGKAE